MIFNNRFHKHFKRRTKLVGGGRWPVWSLVLILTLVQRHHALSYDYNYKSVEQEQADQDFIMIDNTDADEEYVNVEEEYSMSQEYGGGGDGGGSPGSTSGDRFSMYDFYSTQNYSDNVECNHGNNICNQGIFKWHANKTKNLHVGGIFPMVGGWPGGQACLPSAIMALNEINMNASILPGYKLNLNWFNSECDPGKGISNLYEMIYKKNNSRDDIIMLLGPGCSDVSSSVAEAANFWNLTVISFGSSSPALSNRRRFKTFFRTHPSAILDNPARLELCKKYGWKKIATLQDAKEVFTSTVDNLEQEAKNFNIEILVRQTFNDDPTDAVKNLKKQDARIIVGVFYEDLARKVFCRAYKEDMLFPKYIWLIIGWYSENWYREGNENDIGCNRTELEIAVYGHITTEVQFFGSDEEKKLDNGISVREYNDNFNKFVGSSIWKSFVRPFPIIDDKYKQSVTYERNTLLELYKNIRGERHQNIKKLGGYLERPLAYDAVWVLADALNKTLTKFGSLTNFNLSNHRISEYIKNTMKNTDFEGISGRVRFNDQGDRISDVTYEQLQKNENGQLYYQYLGKHSTNKFFCCDNITWGALNKVPIDGVQRVEKAKKINPLYSHILSVVSICIILAGILCLVFNEKYKHRRIINYSTPVINNVMIVGFILCLLSVLIFGFDRSILTVTQFNIVCQTQISLLMIGFSIAYGSLFSKIWFVYTASIEQKKRKINNIAPRQLKLLSVIFVMVLVDLVVIIVWTIYDPLRPDKQELSIEKGENDETIIAPFIKTCKSKLDHIWISISFSIKGIVLVLGLYLSYGARNANLERLNDSKYVALSIYNIVVLTLITAPVTILIRTQIDGSFLFLSVAINVCSLVTLALIFLPKIKHVIKHSAEDDLIRNDSQTNAEQQKRDRYAKLVKENDELTEQIARREELYAKLEKLMSPHLINRRTENHHLRIASEKVHFGSTLIINAENSSTISASTSNLLNSSSFNIVSNMACSNANETYNHLSSGATHTEISTPNPTVETEF